MEVQTENAKLARRVKQLEKKVATLSVLNGALKDENDQVKERLKSQGGASASGGKDPEIEELTQEFAERLAQIENKLLDVTEQRDDLRAELRAAQDDTESKSTRMKDKDDTIASLQEEGDELARKVGELEATVKKLRSSLSKETAERERLQEHVQAVKKGLRKGDNANGDSAHGNDKFQALSDELEQERDKYASMSGKLKKEYNTKLEEYKAQLEEQHKHEVVALREKEYNLVEQVQRLQDSLVELEGNSAEREESVRKENRFLEHKCQQLESKLAEMSSSYSEQSKPYLEEIDHLRSEALKGAEEAEAEIAQYRARLRERDKQMRVLEGKLLASETIAMSTEEVVIKLKETVADTNSQLEQQHDRVLGALRKAATLENEVKTLKEGEQNLLKDLDRKQIDFEEKLRDKSSEIGRLKEKYEGIIKSNGEVIKKQEGEINNLGNVNVGVEETESGGLGLEDLLRDSNTKLNWGLHMQGQQRDETGEVESLKERLRNAEQSRDDALEACSKAVSKSIQQDKEIADLTKRYDTAVILVGEGEERVEQLEDDIREMKQIFHNSIMELSSKT